MRSPPQITADEVTRGYVSQLMQVGYVVLKSEMDVDSVNLRGKFNEKLEANKAVFLFETLEDGKKLLTFLINISS